MVCTPEPPSSHPCTWFAPDGSSGGRRVFRATGVGDALRGFSVFLDGAGAGAELLRAGVGLGETLGRGVAEAAKSVGADCATGAVGLVDPTTKWTVMMTAVTLAAVHDSQMSR
ncbi:hypothetical protein OG735_33395 [Streptomyces sp. NBC_01210]|uniref:hypothetical protein n=1 Tax=Streptomyces sp. NBC_01210 TaxID=2903774 RepID=UPI002E102045|nr:hypothetical protein OG735_33395 [Streptomyces sp. NBC_01210]